MTAPTTASLDERVRHALAQFGNQDVAFLWAQDVTDFHGYLAARNLKIVEMKDEN